MWNLTQILMKEKGIHKCGMSACMKLNVIGMQLSLMQQRFQSTPYYKPQWHNQWMSLLNFDEMHEWDCIAQFSFHPSNSIRFDSFGIQIAHHFHWIWNCFAYWNFNIFICIQSLRTLKMYDFSQYILLRRHSFSLNEFHLTFKSHWCEKLLPFMIVKNKMK